MIFKENFIKKIYNTIQFYITISNISSFYNIRNN